jgi:RNA polymerase sigma-70 factor (ECF subfamily)
VLNSAASSVDAGEMEGAGDDLDAWVAAAQAGSGWAFERIWKSLAGPITGYLRARGVSEPDDATSEVFLSAFRGMAGFEGDGAAFRSWLFTIAHHRAVDSHRQRRPEVRDVIATDRSAVAASAEDEVLEDQDLMQLLAELPLAQREVIWLRIVLDLSISEVCTITGRQPDAIKQLQRRGLDRLRRHLNGATSDAGITPWNVISFTGLT